MTVYGVQQEGGLLIGESKTNLRTILLCVPIHTHNTYLGNHFHSSILSVYRKDRSEVCLLSTMNIANPSNKLCCCCYAFCHLYGFVQVNSSYISWVVYKLSICTLCPKDSCHSLYAFANLASCLSLFCYNYAQLFCTHQCLVRDVHVTFYVTFCPEDPSIWLKHWEGPNPLFKLLIGEMPLANSPDQFYLSLSNVFSGCVFIKV